MENITIIIMMLFGIVFLGILSNKYNFPFPIVLVLSGIVISVIPGLPVIALSPEVVFIIFLPPLLYYAAWHTSWHDFKGSLRPIGLAAIGLVFFTTFAVAVAAHELIDGLGWPLAFLIGAIVSPPDAVAATSITKGLGLSPRLITILEGESLVNDASGLVAYKYALTAITAGNFIIWEASLNFFVMVVAGIAIGLALGYIMYLVHKKFVCDPIVEVTLTFLTPFASYLLAEHFHFSGVLAVVSTGLYLSFRSGQILTHQSRIMATNMWDVVAYILNGLIFILIGLQLRHIMEGMDGYSTGELILWGGIVSLVVIVVRFVWIFPAMMLPRVLGKKLRANEILGGRDLTVFGWAGMRGVVSMAAALALPLALPDGSVFPHRSLIIFLTFCVILTTLVGLGLTLPWLIKKMKIEPYSIYAEEYEVRNLVVSQTIAHIEDNLSLIRDELLHNIKSKYEVKFNRLQKTELPSNFFGNGATLPTNIFNEYTQLQIDLINVERGKIDQLHRKGGASEEVLRKIERELDLEETRLMMDMYDG